MPTKLYEMAATHRTALQPEHTSSGRAPPESQQKNFAYVTIEDMQKLERLVAITLLLQARGKMTATRLANILGVSIRTIYRDITALSLAHIPISMDYGPGGGYYLPDDYHFESAIFTREEAVSLVLSADMAGKYSLFAGDDDLHRALFKLEATLPEEYLAYVKEAREHILIDTTAWRTSPLPAPHLEIIRAAVLGACQIEILYPCAECHETSGMQWRRVDPYGLVFKGLSRRHVRTGIWYLIAYCHHCQTFNNFRVGNIEKLCVCEESITIQPNFNLRVYWREARKYLEEQAHPLSVKLRISPAGRQRLWGNYTVLYEEPDGHVIVRVEIESTEAALPYVLSLGADATVLCPKRVREAVASTAQAIATMYSNHVQAG